MLRGGRSESTRKEGCSKCKRKETRANVKMTPENAKRLRTLPLAAVFFGYTTGLAEITFLLKITFFNGIDGFMKSL